jgi:inosine/xanthosine triphosphatase
MIIAVGSTNPTKIRPVKAVFAKLFTHVTVKGVSVDSGVDDQPMTDEVMYNGALNRAKNAIKKVKDAQYGVGIEGGLHKYSYGWFERSLIVIVNRKGDIGVGSSGGLALPNRILKRIHEGKNLEEAVDELFGTHKVGEGIGMFGLMTNNVVTRAAGMKHGVAFALARFLHADLYK